MAALVAVVAGLAACTAAEPSACADASALGGVDGTGAPADAGPSADALARCGFGMWVYDATGAPVGQLAGFAADGGLAVLHAPSGLLLRINPSTGLPAASARPAQVHTADAQCQQPLGVAASATAPADKLWAWWFPPSAKWYAKGATTTKPAAGWYDIVSGGANPCSPATETTATMAALTPLDPAPAGSFAAPLTVACGKP